MTNIKFNMEYKHGGCRFDFPDMKEDEYGIIAYSSNGQYEHLKIDKEEYEEFKIRVSEYLKDFVAKHPNAQI